MELFLVRHADAGSRRAWEDDDRLRPLSPKGLRQAEALARVLGDRPISRIASSPAIRCVQTVGPLAAALALEIEPVDGLREGSSAKEAIEFAEAIDEPAVLSSHGDVIPEMLRGLANRGMTLHDDFRWAKGSVWVISRDRERFTEARYLAPPID